MSSHHKLAGYFARLSCGVAAAGFAGVMLHLGGGLPLWGFPVSAVLAMLGWISLGAPITRRDPKLRHEPTPLLVKVISVIRDAAPRVASQALRRPHRAP